jgi:hypothetical protein
MRTDVVNERSRRPEVLSEALYEDLRLAQIDDVSSSLRTT